jgi:transposase
MTASVTATPFGYREALGLAARHAPGRRMWAVEGTGSYGRGLASFLAVKGERVVEIDRPTRRDARSAKKTDTLDAVRAAHEAISRDHLAAPRAGGDREALRTLYSTREGAIAVRRDGLNLAASLGRHRTRATPRRATHASPRAAREALREAPRHRQCD